MPNQKHAMRWRERISFSLSWLFRSGPLATMAVLRRRASNIRPMTRLYGTHLGALCIGDYAHACPTWLWTQESCSDATEFALIPVQIWLVIPESLAICQASSMNRLSIIDRSWPNRHRNISRHVLHDKRGISCVCRISIRHDRAIPASDIHDHVNARESCTSHFYQSM